MRNLFLALIAGLLFPLAFAPYGLWPLLLVSVALAYWVQASAPSAKAALLGGWVYGLGMFGFGVAWLQVSMTDYGYMPLWMAVPATAAFAALLALFYGAAFWLTRRFRGGGLMFAGAWVLADWLRGWLLTGFPWLYGGYALIDTPLAGLAPLGGIWLMTLAAVILPATAVELVLRRGRGTGPLVLSLALIVAGVVAGQFSFTHAEGERQQVALVQGNVPQDLKWLATMRKETREIYAGLTEGLPWRDESRTPTTYHNSIAVVGTDSDDGVYHKQKLVPFGEYVPLQGLIRGLIPFFDLPMSSFTPGSPRQPNLYALSHEIAPFICYEILYPELVASRTGSADVLLTISNDAWFGTSAGPHQHFQMTRLRALETGRWLLRGTNNGITAVVDHHGKVVERLPQFERDVLVSEYQPRQGETPFMLAGVWPTLLLALAFVVLGRGRRARGLLESF